MPATEASSAKRAIQRLSQVKLFFFAAAGLSMVLSIYLFFGGHRLQGIFVGLWVPSILASGALLVAGAKDE